MPHKANLTTYVEVGPILVAITGDSGCWFQRCGLLPASTLFSRPAVHVRSVRANGGRED